MHVSNDLPEVEIFALQSVTCVACPGTHVWQSVQQQWQRHQATTQQQRQRQQQHSQ